jgi:hypothetical protein
MSGPVFHLNPTGRLANLMIQYMAALKFTQMVPNCRISNMNIPEWGIHHPSIDSDGPIGRVQAEQHIDLTSLAEQVWAREIQRVEWIGFGQRLENFLPRERYQEVFVSPFDTAMGFGAEYLVCPVRAEDILHGPNPDYVLTPVEFYRDIVDMTGLRPVFIGQTQPNPYMDRITALFPRAIIREPQENPLVDFETIRQSRNVVIGVSTYSWLAAWLSRSTDQVFLTVNGLFNPMQKHEVDLLPFGDARYRFFLFPVNYAGPLDRSLEAHRRMAPYWREMPHAVLQQQFAAVPRFKPGVTDAAAALDEDFYLEANPDVAAVAETLGRDFARAHYLNHGHQEGRAAMQVDRIWYAYQYPLAAFEVAQGDYADFVQHYQMVGRARCYRPNPPAGEW